MLPGEDQSLHFLSLLLVRSGNFLPGMTGPAGNRTIFGRCSVNDAAAGLFCAHTCSIVAPLSASPCAVFRGARDVVFRLPGLPQVGLAKVKRGQGAHPGYGQFDLTMAVRHVVGIRNGVDNDIAGGNGDQLGPYIAVGVGEGEGDVCGFTGQQRDGLPPMTVMGAKSSAEPVTGPDVLCWMKAMMRLLLRRTGCA
ncbi:hypothetical protein OG863_00530 [Streptomyces decoyicus]|uniref:Uncharacterized protein n=1 Tax=Streptomyces decoyicus TaxID=249567 RepID=A0ABZ1F8F1_9ACTN|nr:hypothetical protein [Streptomyces decoyicus]WSB66599.1 hypothetical protein OG863_00530 [Streptomyces decoyicus]